MLTVYTDAQVTRVMDVRGASKDMQPAASSRSVRVVKTFLSSLTALLLAVGFLLTGTPSHAETVSATIGNITYTADTENPAAGATATAYTGSGGIVNIPSTVEINGETYALKEIGARAFRDGNLTSVTIPNSVTSIGALAFARNNLTSINIPNSVTSIGSWAFEENNLTSINIPNSVTSIGAGTFINNELTHVTLPNSITAIYGSFANNKLTHVTLPNSLVTLGDRAFYDNNLSSVTFGNSLEVIGREALSNNNLSNITLPDSVTTLDDYAFANNGLTNVNLGNNLTRINNDVFINNSLTSVTIPGSVTLIGDRAFSENPLSVVTFEGNAPSITFSGSAGSFGPGAGKTLRYFSTATRFSTPTWWGYRVEEIPVMRTVTFDPRGGSATSSAEVKHGNRLTPPADPTRTGYTFTGWYTDSNATSLYDFDDAVTEPFTLYAGWELNNYTVTFNTAGGSAIAPVAVAHGNTLTLPAAPTRTGYTFAGWYTYTDGLTRFDPDEPITGSVTLIALWSLNTYTVNFDTGDGSTVAPVSINHGDTVTAPADPVKYGHTFTGWYTDADATALFDFDETVTEALTLYAGWDLNNYSITLDLGDGSPATTVTLNHGDTLPRPADPVREGHTFTGWYITPATATAASFNSATAGTFAFTSAADGVLYDFDTPVTGPITLYAGWSLNSYTVSFDTGDGSAVDPITVNYGDTFPIPADPTRAGYSFTGWFTDPETTTAYDPDAVITGELTLYAGWEKIVEPAAKTDETKALSATGTTGPSDLLGAGFLAAIAGLLVILGRRRLTAGN